MSLNSLIFTGDDYDPDDAQKATKEYGWLKPHERKELYQLQKSWQQQKKKDPRSPSRIFLDLLNKNTTKAFINYKMLEDRYVWKDKVLSVFEKWEIEGVQESKSFVLMLNRVFVVGAERGKGYGTDFITTIKQWAEIAGVVIVLVAGTYELSGREDSEGGNHTTTIQEVIELDNRQNIHYHHFNQDLINDWYLRQQFMNAKILPNRPDHQYALDSQFLFYKPSSLAPENLKEIEKILV